MPSKDRLHDTVVRTLVKDGWSIVKEQFFVNFPDSRLWIDIQASKVSENRVILVEVKGFDHPSPVEYLASAVGKYTLYRAALAYMGINLPLYLAVPIAAYEGILSQLLGQVIVQQLDISLFVFDSEKTEVFKWIPSSKS